MLLHVGPYIRLCLTDPSVCLLAGTKITNFISSTGRHELQTRGEGKLIGLTAESTARASKFREEHSIAVAEVISFGDYTALMDSKQSGHVPVCIVYISEL